MPGWSFSGEHALLRFEPFLNIFPFSLAIPSNEAIFGMFFKL